MVQHAILAEAADRGPAAGSGRSAEARWVMEGRMGHGPRARVASEDRELAAPTSAPAAGFFELVAGVLQRRLHDRSRREGQILERREGAGASRDARERACGT